MDQIEQAYNVLELETGAAMAEVNQAYKDLVFIWHPDRIPAERDRLREKAEAKLKALNEARSFLRSQVKNGKIPARSTVNRKQSQSQSRNSQPGYSRYRPSSRAASRTASAYQSSASSSDTRAGSYRPPYEAYRRASTP